MKIVTLSSKNQITIPKDMLGYLGIQKQSKLMIDYRENEMVIKPLRSSIVSQTAGSLTKYVAKNKLGKSWNEIMKQTKNIVAKKLATEI